MKPAWVARVRRHPWLPAVVACVALRGAWMLFVHPEPIADYAFYFTRAAELAEGLGYRFQGHPTAFFPIGTSLILAGPFALFGPSLALASALSLVAATLSVLLLFRLGERLTDRRTAAVAALLLALHPDLIAFSALVASENFFMPALLCGLWLLILPEPGSRIGRLRRATAGLLFGLALLVRSTALILFPAVLLYLLWKERQNWRSALLAAVLFGAGVVLALGPWLVRNASELGKPVLTTNGGISLWWGNNPAASGGFPLTGEKPTQDLSTAEAEVQNDRSFRDAAFAFIRNRPLDWLALVPAKLRYLFTAVSPDIGFALRHRYVGGQQAIEHHPRLGDGRSQDQAEFVERPLHRIESLMIGGYYHVAGGNMGGVWPRTLWALGVTGLIVVCLTQARRRPEAMLVLAVPITWLSFHITLGNGQPRYLLSVMPFIVLGAAHLAVVAYRGRSRLT